MLIKKINTIYRGIIFLSLSFFIDGCSSQQEVLSVSESHLYNEKYGLNANYEADKIIEQELLAIHHPKEEIDHEVPLDSTWTTELTVDKDAFLAENYEEKAPVISYKYKFDPKFYSKAEWRSME